MDTETPKVKLEYDPTDLISVRCWNYEQGAANAQLRRHEDWRETYSLYRDKVVINRLTQRQSVNVPLMKETIRTVLAKTDEFADLYFESKDGDKLKEIYINEYWKDTFIKDKLEVKDITDKKQEYLYGVSHMKLNLIDGRFTAEVLEPYDILTDRFADPADIDNTANYRCHRHIYRTLSQLMSNSFYDQDKVKELIDELKSSMTVVRDPQPTLQDTQDADARLQDMGQWDMLSPSVGETVVELKEHYIKLWSVERKKLLIHLRVTANNKQIMKAIPLEDLLGINFFPIVTWSDDIERTDLYPDGIGDIVRTPNKILNSMISQLVENRTLRNFGMNFYDSTAGDNKWVPQMYEPVPWGWYPTPGDPNKLFKNVQVNELGDSMNEMNFIKGLAETATAATATQKGDQEPGSITLGEIEIITANANQRISSIAKFYRLARKELGEKFCELVLNNPDKISATTLHKKSYKGNWFAADFSHDKIASEKGYNVTVVSSAEREQKTLEAIQKLKAVAQDFPNNMPLKQILQKKELDLLDISPEEIKSVLDFEKQSSTNPMSGMVPSVTPPGAPAGGLIPGAVKSPLQPGNGLPSPIATMGAPTQ